MAGKKKKTGKRKKRRFPKALAAVSAVLLAGLAGLLLYMYLKDDGLSTAVPVYEEIHAAVPRLDRQIRGVDRAIYESLYRHKTPDEDIRFLRVQSRCRQEHRWDFTELRVACRHRVDVVKLAETLDNALRTLAPSVEFEKTALKDGQVGYRISSLGLETHRLILSRERSKRAVVKRPRVAIIIDDLGHDPKVASSFMNLGLPLTLSILPYAPFSRSIAREALEKGFELLLHVPMEPKGYPSVHPGPGALLLSMKEEEIHTALRSILDEIPGVAGVNNHMGSMFTENRAKMGIVLRELKRRNLFYVDSRTTSRTVGYEMALDMGIPTASRSVFLDNDLESVAIRVQIDRLKGLARHSGNAVGIAHPFRETLEVLRKSAPSMSSELDLVPVSELLN